MAKYSLDSRFEFYARLRLDDYVERINRNVWNARSFIHSSSPSSSLRISIVLSAYLSTTSSFRRCEDVYHQHNFKLSTHAQQSLEIFAQSPHVMSLRSTQSTHAHIVLCTTDIHYIFHSTANYHWNLCFFRLILHIFFGICVVWDEASPFKWMDYHRI